MDKVKAPGLKWRKLAGGLCPVWIADEADVKRGYSPKTVNLKHIADQPEILKAKCAALQADMLLWRSGYRHDPLAFDGTVKSLLSIYQRHPESPFHRLKPGTLHPYKFYLGKLEGHIGERRIEAVNGIDVVRWHGVWSQAGEHLAAAAMARAVLGAALAFGTMLRLAGCPELSEILKVSQRKLAGPQGRKAKMTAGQVVAARAAAHAAGRKSSALAYAVAFETTLRIWDVIGQWWPIDREGISDVVNSDRKEKWFGLRWENIDEQMVLTFTPSKTDGTSGRTVSYSLDKAPMVMEELAHWPSALRRGPMIVAEGTGLPWREARFADGWRRDRKAAGIDASVWARDLRASGISEGRAAAASTDDARQVAGHTTTRSTDRYDRAVLEAADRFADARIRGRERSGNGGGNAR